MADAAEVVIAEVQESAAQEVAREVAQVVAVTDGMIAAEVGAVGAELREHAAVSEERHEEILEGVEEWQDAYQLLNAGISSLQAAQLATQQSLTEFRVTVMAMLELIQQTLSTGSQQSTPQQSIPAVEPQAAVVSEDVQPVPATKRKGLRVI